MKRIKKREIHVYMCVNSFKILIQFNRFQDKWMKKFSWRKYFNEKKNYKN